jgi:ElaB/YqjD/DUF883 family membrane-anchored ribosome-binding protein
MPCGGKVELEIIYMESTTETRDALVKDVQQIKDDVAKITNDAKSHAHAHVDHARQRVNDAVATAQAQLAAHPFAILGFGVVLGFFFGRRRRHRS